MVATHSGHTGLSVPSHVDRELSIALVHAPIPYQQTVDWIAADLEEPRNCKDVTHRTAQVKALLPIFKRPLNADVCLTGRKCSHNT